MRKVKHCYLFFFFLLSSLRYRETLGSLLTNTCIRYTKITCKKKVKASLFNMEESENSNSNFTPYLQPDTGLGLLLYFPQTFSLNFRGQVKNASVYGDNPTQGTGLSTWRERRKKKSKQSPPKKENTKKNCPFSKTAHSYSFEELEGSVRRSVIL